MVTSLVSDFASALRINEIMYHPNYNEDYNEWIELYNEDDGPVDISNYTLCNKQILAGFITRDGEIQQEQGLILESHAYALITDGGTSGTEVYDNYHVAPDSLALHTGVATLCGGLNNQNGETVRIALLNETIDEVTYANDAPVGFSLEFREGEFSQSALIDGTPGSENSEGSDGGNNTSPPPHNDTSTNSTGFTNTTRKKDTPRIKKEAPSFVPLDEEGSVPDGEVKKEKKKIVLSSTQETSPRATSDHYVTPEGKVRQTIIYVFAGFCVVLTLLIALRKV